MLKTAQLLRSLLLILDYYGRPEHPVPTIGTLLPGWLVNTKFHLADSPPPHVSLCFWPGFLHWRDALVVVKPETLIGWHRKTFLMFWRWKSREGRPRLPKEMRALIAEMARQNPTWGETRVALELHPVVKLLPDGFRHFRAARFACKNSSY